MDPITPRAQFAQRMHVVCDLLDIPAGHGRQTRLAQLFSVTPKAARKWLTGLSYPELEKAVEICDRANVSVTWLLQGAGPMRTSPAPSVGERVADAIDALPADARERMLDYLKYQVSEQRGWLTAERTAYYSSVIDAARGPRRSLARQH